MKDSEKNIPSNSFSNEDDEIDVLFLTASAFSVEVLFVLTFVYNVIL